MDLSKKTFSKNCKLFQIYFIGQEFLPAAKHNLPLDLQTLNPHPDLQKIFKKTFWSLSQNLFPPPMGLLNDKRVSLFSKTKFVGCIWNRENYCQALKSQSFVDAVIHFQFQIPFSSNPIIDGWPLIIIVKIQILNEIENTVLLSNFLNYFIMFNTNTV